MFYFILFLFSFVSFLLYFIPFLLYFISFLLYFMLFHSILIFLSFSLHSLFLYNYHNHTLMAIFLDMTTTQPQFSQNSPQNRLSYYAR